MRTNLVALRDLIATLGAVQGFNYSVATGTNAKPTKVYFTRSSEVVRVDLAYDGNDLVTKMAFYYSSTGSSPGTFYPMADVTNGFYVLTINYDGNFDVTTTAWGLTP